MPNFQQITILGHATKDGELRTTQNGKSVCSFGVAVNDYNKNTTFYDCAAWGKTAENYASKYLKKGCAVMVVGEPRLNLYEKNDGTQGASIQIFVKDMQIMNSNGQTSGDTTHYGEADVVLADDNFVPF